MIRPKTTPRKVWEKYGFPLVSKEVAENIHAVRVNPTSTKSLKALGVERPDSMFVLSNKWQYLIEEPYETSNKCCQKLKKDPSHEFAKETGLKPIIGIMASESLLREKTYIRRGGCNVSEITRLLILSLFGLTMIFGSLFERETSNWPTYIAKGQNEPGVQRVGLGANSNKTHGFEFCTRTIRSIMI